MMSCPGSPIASAVTHDKSGVRNNPSIVNQIQISIKSSVRSGESFIEFIKFIGKYDFARRAVNSLSGHLDNTAYARIDQKTSPCGPVQRES